MSIHKIVITGGPCAGKSESLQEIKKAIEPLGYRVIIVNECATQLLTAGITPESCGSVLEFEKRQMKLQIETEEKTEQAASAFEDPKILIVYDRGCMDTKAFVSDAEFKEILKYVGKSEVELRDRYDAVFHMESTAHAENGIYKKESNAVRMENEEEAAALDDRTLLSWVGTPHLRVVGFDMDFSGKTDDLINKIKNSLGEPKPLEIEKKYLIEYPDMKMLKDDPRFVKTEISQTYLEDEEGDFRVRKRGTDREYIYFLTRKKDISASVRVEEENRISREEYEAYIKAAKRPLRQIMKERYCFVYEKKYFELDVFPFWKDKAFLEIELESEDEKVNLPPEFKIIRDVTEDKEYRNASLAKKMAE